MTTIEYFEKIIDSYAVDYGNPTSVEQFDNRQMKFSVYLLNQDGRIVKIRKGSIEELVINDDILEWFHTGHIIFDNPHDILERGLLTMESDTGNINNHLTYKFRGDGRDFIYIYLEPSLTNEIQTSKPNSKLQSNTHTMKLLMTVYAIEDIEDQRGKNFKKQKLYLHDYRLQQLREKNLYYSTAKNITGELIGQKNNRDRSKRTGEIIQDIIGAGLTTPDTTGLFSKHWDFGGTSLFYTSPSNNKAIDDLNYILDRHVSSGEQSYSPCILKLQRNTERWELLPLATYFDRAHDNNTPGVYQSEHYKLSSELNLHQTGQGIPTGSKTFPEYLGHSASINYHIPDTSIIEDYNFSEMSGVDCREILTSSIVHRYNDATKTFYIDVADGNMRMVHGLYQSLYTSKMKGDSGIGYPSWFSDSTRDSNLNINVLDSWSADKVSSLTVGRNKKLLAAFLLGNSINFKVKGHPSRKAGVWITMDRAHDYIDNDYESKVLGQYFVTSSQHIITKQGYRNNIIAAKPYLFSPAGIDTSDLFSKSPEKITI